MGIKERQQRERLALRNEILEATRSIAAEEGWQAVTVRKVAARVEYSTPVIYEHFGSKHALLMELVHEGLGLALRAVDSERQRAADPEDALLKVAEAYWDSAFEHPELYQVAYGLHGVPFGTEEAPKEALEMFYTFRDAISAASPAASPPDLRDRVHMLWGYLHGLISLTMANRVEGGDAYARGLIAPVVTAFVRDWSLADDPHRR